MPEVEVSFVELFNDVLRELGRRQPRTPGRALEMWSDFVEDCEEGYSATLFEYWDDLSVRRFLQAVVASPGIGDMPDAAWFLDEVAGLDLRLKSVLEGGFEMHGGWGWWERRIPRFAGEEMARDVREQFGFEMEVV
ncbi:hypothetical protein [Streptomyces sp. NPDC020983]|uniref:hypothetical protein n=1 Tax=Streptomyces sp. NPDC020983 TaxID=3365106 RepID=UPI00378F5C5A